MIAIAIAIAIATGHRTWIPNSCNETPTMAQLLFLKLFILATGIIRLAGAYKSELWDDSDLSDLYRSPLPISYIDPKDIPDSFSWGDVHGKNFLTRSLNQHIPQYW